MWSPYPDDPVFQAKYAAFVRAFAKRFDDPGTVDFIDGYGLGKWGEGHSMRYVDYANREAVLRWVVDLYADSFTRVPLAINYHRLIGAEKDWGAPDADSERLLDIAVDRGFILRHDAFGMTTYYGDWERAYAEKWRYRRPILMEGGWVTTQHNYTVDPRGTRRSPTSGTGSSTTPRRPTSTHWTSGTVRPCPGSPAASTW